MNGLIAGVLYGPGCPGSPRHNPLEGGQGEAGAQGCRGVANARRNGYMN